MFTRSPEHVLRCVDADNAASWQCFQQLGGETPGSTPGIENNFVAAKIETRKDLFSPADLRRGEAVVRVGVPFACIRFGMITQVSVTDSQISSQIESQDF